jgi:hypothetical protein
MVARNARISSTSSNRVTQRAMARAVARNIDHAGHLAVETGTASSVEIISLRFDSLALCCGAVAREQVARCLERETQLQVAQPPGGSLGSTSRDGGREHPLRCGRERPARDRDLIVGSSAEIIQIRSS